MTVENVVFLVEEPSTEALLLDLLPRMLGETPFEVHAFSCKHELLDKLEARLRGYARWIPESYRIVVIVDRDGEPCRRLKKRLEAMAREAGVPTRARPLKGSWIVVNRLAVEELEAWYFGDWEAVCAAYPRASKSIPMKERYRNPDAITGGTWEAFERILQRAGYFTGGLRKIEAARAIAPHMDPERNSSRSFQVLRDALTEMASEPACPSNG